MTDDELIDLVARLWIANGGDSDGMAWCWKDIKDRIKELENEKAG